MSYYRNQWTKFLDYALREEIGIASTDDFIDEILELINRAETGKLDPDDDQGLLFTFRLEGRKIEEYIGVLVHRTLANIADFNNADIYRQKHKPYITKKDIQDIKKLLNNKRLETRNVMIRYKSKQIEVLKTQTLVTIEMLDLISGDTELGANRIKEIMELDDDDDHYERQITEALRAFTTSISTLRTGIRNGLNTDAFLEPVVTNIINPMMTVFQEMEKEIGEGNVLSEETLWMILEQLEATTNAFHTIRDNLVESLKELRLHGRISRN